MPRKPKPAYMFGKPGDRANKTKAVKKLLQEHTVMIGGKRFKMPRSIEKNKIAKAKWIDIMGLYKDSDVSITTNADIGLLERYCLTYAEYCQLMVVKEEIINVSSDIIVAISKLHDLRIDMKINQKNTLLLKMDTELFLTPLSKCRAIPRTSKKNHDKDKLRDKGFNV